MDNNQQFIDAEYCIDKYFESHIKSRLDFTIDCRNSAVVSGQLSGFGVRNALFPSEEYATNVTLNFPANDIEKICAEMMHDKSLKHDIEVLTKTWRQAAVAKVGEAKYKELSRELGVDLATAYVSHRMLMRMVDYEVEKNPIQGSADFILDEARRSSMLSYLSPSTSDIQHLIDKKVIARYNPSLLERGVGKTLGSLTDMVITAPMMGTASWARLGKFVTLDLGVGMVGDALENDEMADNDVSRIVSAALFEGDDAILAGYCSKSKSVNPYSSEVVTTVDEQLGQKIVRRSSINPFQVSLKPFTPMFNIDLPKIPDYAAQLRQDLAIHEHFACLENAENQHQKAQAEQNVTPVNMPLQSVQQPVSGWGGLFDGIGLSGFGDVGKNLGYVLAMLPDMLIGMITGKSRNLKFGDNMMPIAAIIAGMFVRNPLLKMLLVGLGGANLLNKAGHEALENRDGVRPQPVRQYREYADEVLDLRLKQPVMKGNTLVVTIDDTPSVITVSDDAVDAYYQGKLPLNTLANAVLRKYDEQQQAVQQNYERQLSQQHIEEPTLALK